MGDDGTRGRLGFWVVICASGALAVLAIVVLVGAAVVGKDDFSKNTQLLFSSLLPLFGTWVGTVLAYYFSKDNFETASKGTMDLVRSIQQRLVSTKVADTMMPRSRIVLEVVPAGKSIDDIELSAVERQFTTIGANGQRISRLMIAGSGDACIAMLHRSTYTEMLAAGLRAATPINPSTAKLGDLLGLDYPGRPGAKYKDFVQKTVAFVAADRTLADAKAAMEAVPGCQDVIVTKTGLSTEPIMGWISNIDIARLSQA
jgi:hypothetical protein